MADLTHSDLVLHAVRDDEGGYLHLVTDYDGVLLPVQSVPLGVLDSLKKAAENDVHPGITTTVVAPSKQNGGNSDSETVEQ